MAIGDSLIKIWQHKDLRARIFYVFGLLVLARILAHIPLPGVDLESLRTFFSRNQLFGLLDMFSGGTMSNFSIVLMGVGPYITASIIMQLLGVVIPSLEALQKEGEWGQRKLNQYTRWLTIPMAIVQAFGMISLLRSQGAVNIDWNFFNMAVILISTTGGTILLMWLGELISENGIGNGISLIITLGIIAGFPSQIRNTLAVVDTTKIIGLIILAIVAVLTVLFIVVVTEGERRVPVAYARRIVGRRSYGGVETHLPIRVNVAGVIPIIFAMSIMLFPSTLAKFLEQARSAWLANAASWTSRLFQNNLFYGIMYFILVVGFTFFYTAIVFKPQQVAENLQKQGGFIPAIRPGQQTSQYLDFVLKRITLAGAIFLGIIAVLPFIVQAATSIKTLVIGGTGLLIIISVIIDTMRNIQSQLLMRTYEQY